MDTCMHTSFFFVLVVTAPESEPESSKYSMSQKGKLLLSDLYSYLGFISAKRGTVSSDLTSLTLSFSFTVAGREAVGALWGGAFLIAFLTLTEGTAIELHAAI